MKSILFSAVAFAFGKELPTFESFIELHGRSYKHGSVEFEQRKALYEQRVKDAEQHNGSPHKKWVAGVNKLWDWTEPELKTLQGWDGSARPARSSLRSVMKHGAFLQRVDDLPKEKSWDKLVTFSYTKDQKNCGSCWAIASATTLEAHNEIYNKDKTHRVFSTQQIVDCTPNPRQCGGEGGCKGATAELAMDWVLKNGIADATEVPYQGVVGECTRGSLNASTNLNASTKPGLLQVSAPVAQGGAAFGMMGWSTLPKNEYAPLIRALVETGPVAVSTAADQWFAYDEGIFDGCQKDAVISHAVVATGYGEEDGTKYWKIMNSWGSDWGENGAIRLLRHEKGGYCGMNHDPQMGVGCKGETEPVPVCGMCGVLFDSVIPHFKGATVPVTTWQVVKL